MWVGFLKVNLIFLEVFFIKQELLINEKIRAKEVQLIGANGEKLGIVSLDEALDRAQDAKLDLALICEDMYKVLSDSKTIIKIKLEYL